MISTAAATGLPRPPAAPLVLVEDDRDVRELFVRIISLFGYEVVACGSCRAALGYLALAPAGVLLTDLFVGDGDGTELIRAVQASWPQTRAILMTGFPVPGLREQARALGVAGLLAKPVDIGALREAIRGAYEEYEAARAAAG